MNCIQLSKFGVLLDCFNCDKNRGNVSKYGFVKPTFSWESVSRSNLPFYSVLHVFMIFLSIPVLT